MTNPSSRCRRGRGFTPALAVVVALGVTQVRSFSHCLTKGIGPGVVSPHGANVARNPRSTSTRGVDVGGRRYRSTSTVRGATALPTAVLGNLAHPSMDASAHGALAPLPVGLLVSMGELTNTEVIVYFGFLLTLIAVPFALGFQERYKVSEFREKRENFIAAIEAEIAGLTELGDPESLTTAKELQLKLQEVYDTIEKEKRNDDDSKFFGLNKIIREWQGGGTNVSPAEMASPKTQQPPKPNLEKMNRYDRRMAQKSGLAAGSDQEKKKKRKKSKLDL